MSDDIQTIHHLRDANMHVSSRNLKIHICNVDFIMLPCITPHGKLISQINIHFLWNRRILFILILAYYYCNSCAYKILFLPWSVNEINIEKVQRTYVRFNTGLQHECSRPDHMEECEYILRHPRLAAPPPLASSGSMPWQKPIPCRMPLDQITETCFEVERRVSANTTKDGRPNLTWWCKLGPLLLRATEPWSRIPIWCARDAIGTCDFCSMHLADWIGGNWPRRPLAYVKSWRKLR